MDILQGWIDWMNKPEYKKQRFWTNQILKDWSEERAKQNVCDSTRSVYPLLCAGFGRSRIRSLYE